MQTAFLIHESIKLAHMQNGNPFNHPINSEQTIHYTQRNMY